MAEEFLDSVNQSHSAWLQPLSGPDRPFVTLTYAQTLDGRVASLPGEPRLLISGIESMEMTFKFVSAAIDSSVFNCTYRLRSVHAGILVTVNTVLDDDPSLTGKHQFKLLSISDPVYSTRQFYTCFLRGSAAIPNSRPEVENSPGPEDFWSSRKESY